MSASYSLFKTHCGASGVEQSTTGNFTSPTDVNLIVAKSNIIEIYKLPDDSPSIHSTNQLILISRYSLFGEVQDIKTARFVPNHTDSLLITFPDAKLTIIDFDASSRTIITTALFNFDPLYRRIGNITSAFDLIIRIDPLGRCAALQLSDDLLFILPLFVNYLLQHKQRKGSNPINIIYYDTLANEYQQEIEDEEQRLNPGMNNHRNGNHNHNRNNNKYISPLPPPLPLPGGHINNDDGNHANNDEELEDVQYIQAMKGDNKEFDDDGEWDEAYKKHKYYQYHSLCSKHYFIMNLRAKCQKIIDFIFLDGYNTPQILMLFEKTNTWGGRVPVRNKTISLLSITVNVVRRSYNIPFILSNILSYDFNKLYPISSSSNMLHSSIILQQSHTNKHNFIQTNIGGAFLIGSNAILHFGQNIDFGLSFNQHGDILSKDFPLLRKWTERVINLETPVITALDNNKGNTDFLLSDGNGFMYLLSIESGKMNLCTLGIGPIPSTMIHLNDNINNKFIFIGSRLGDSLLLKHTIRKIIQKQKQPKQPIVNAEEQEMFELKDQLFGDNNKNEKKRTFSEMDVDSNNNANNNDDLAMNLFGVTTENLAAAAENNTDNNNNSIALDPTLAIAISNGTPSKKKTQPRLKHLSLYGPKVKRRKLTGKTELQMHDLHFMNVVDFDDEKLFELELEKENRSRPISSFLDENMEQKNENQDEEIEKQYRQREQTLREKYEFKICDKMTNLSPITSLVMSKSYDARFLHCDYINLMAATGFGTQAKLSILQEGIRPQILAKTNSDKIISAVNCWSLWSADNIGGNHNYLIATDLQQTQVIDISDKIVPMNIDNENSIKLDVRSILCGHIGKYIIQIYANGIRILNDMTMINELEIDTIIDGYICDSYVLLHLNDKSIRLCVFNEEKIEFDVREPEIEDLKRYKQISDDEKERRKKEFIVRRCNKMTLEQYMKLEACINDFCNNCVEMENDMNGLMEYIDEMLINPIGKEDEPIEDFEQKTNSMQMKEEISVSDSDDQDVQIELADDLKQQIMTSTTGWQSSDWRTNNNNKKKKTLFNLGLNLDIILKRLYGKLENILMKSKSRNLNDILMEMITKDLDCGVIEKCYLYKYNRIKCKKLSELNNNWTENEKYLASHSAATYQQLLSTSYQTKRLDIKALKTLKKNRNGNGKDSEEKLLTGLFFGTGENDNENMDVEMDDENKEEFAEDECEQVFVVLARSSGVLQIFCVPDFVLVFECSELHIGHGLLCNNLIHDESLTIILSKHQLTKRKNLKDFIRVERENKLSNAEIYFEDELIPQALKDELWCSSTNMDDDSDGDEYETDLFVEDLFVSVLNCYPYLLVILNNGDLLVYEMFEYFVGGTQLRGSVGRNLNEENINNMNILPLRLNRFKHKLFTRKKFDEIENGEINKIKKKMYEITDINGLKGILVSVPGNNPIMILGGSGCPIIHNLSVNDDIRGFAMFSNDNITVVAQDKKIKNGYIYFNQYGLIIGTIPQSMHNIAQYEKDIEKEENKKEEEKTNKEEEEMELEQEENMEIFGHSLVLQKERISNLLQYSSIDYSSHSDMCVCDIPLSQTLHFIIQHPQSGTYLLIMSRYKYIFGTEMLSTRDIKPIETYFECRLLNPYKWRYDDRLTGFIIHQNQSNTCGGGGEDEINEDENNSIAISEHILCVKSVNIEETSRIGSQTIVNKNLIILGTGTNQGEDNASIGRIVMLEIIPEKENEKLNTNIITKNERFYIQTKKNSDENLLNKSIAEISLENENMTYKYINASNGEKKYYKKELQYYKKCMEQDKINNIRYRIHYVFARRERAAVTALNCVNGLIIAAIGPKLLLFRWDGTQLIGCAFLDTRIHCHNILVLKNFVATSDLFQGLDLYHWEQDIASIVKLARDVQYRSIYSVFWRIYNNNHQQPHENNKIKEFDFLVSDMTQNLHIISYQPHLFQRFGFLSKMDKEKLYTKCLFHIGTNITDSIILKMRNNNNDYFNLNGCCNGSINYLIPINEQIYRRLNSLHSQMIFYCKHNCGLNPREYRYAMNNCMTNKNNSGRKSHVMYNHSQLNSIHGCDRSNTLTSKNIIDHDLIKEFVNLDYRTQNKLTQNIGVKNANVIINHLKQLYNNTKWF